MTSTSRFPVLPDVPTVAEAGVPGYDGDTWIGLLAPAGTPRSVVARLADEIKLIAHDPEFRAKLAGVGMRIAEEDTPQKFGAFMKEDVEKWEKVIHAEGIKAK